MQNVSQLQVALQNKNAACIKEMRPCVEQFIAALPADQEDPMLFLIENGFADDALMRAFNEKYVANLVKVWGYKALPPLYSMAARHLYEESLPSWVQKQRHGAENTALVSEKGTLLASGYSRVVIGDYGAFLEISPEQIHSENLRIKKGEEYRLEPRYSHAKYIWLEPVDGSSVKVYYQQHKVTYADYLPGMYYVSPYEVIL